MRGPGRGFARSGGTPGCAAVCTSSTAASDSPAGCTRCSMTLEAPSHIHSDGRRSLPHTNARLQARGWRGDRPSQPPSQESSPLLQGVLKVSRENCRGKGQGQAPKLLSSGLIPRDSDGLDTDRGLRLHWEWRSGQNRVKLPWRGDSPGDPGPI